MTPAPEEQADVRVLGGPAAALVGWLVGALVNSAFVIALPWPKAGLGIRLLHHVYDIGHFLALGLLSLALVSAWSRWAPRGLAWRIVGITCASSLVGALVLPDDLMNFSRSFPGPPSLVTAALVVAVACLVPAGYLAALFLAGRGFRLVAVALGTMAFVLNNLVLAGDYSGGHFIFAMVGAATVGASATGLPLVGRLSPWLAKRRRWSALAIVGAWGLTSVVAQPSQAVLVQLGLLDGAVVAPQLARIRDALVPETSLAASDIPPDLQPWFVDRSDAPPIPASQPALLPEDAVVLLVSIDSMRAELLQDERYRATLPRMWAIAEQSVQFSLARAPGSTTRAVIGSVLTGKHRTQLDWGHSKRLQWHLQDDDSVQFPELLGDVGIPTMQAISFKYLQKKFRVVRGFEEEVFVAPTEGQRFALADAVLEPVVARLEEHEEGPLFLWAHLMDPHYPYDAGGTEGDTFDRYVAEVAACDAAIGRLWDAIDRIGLRKRVVLVLTADHGEGHGKHNTPHHGTTVYEELVRVPLVVYVPNVAPRVVDEPVSLMDLGPTILDLFGQPTPGDFMGQSLVPFLRGESPGLTRPIGGTTLVGRLPVYFLMTGPGEKVVWNRKSGAREIYDVVDDPDEEVNLYDDLGDEGERRFALLRTFFQGHDFFAKQNERAEKAATKKKSKKKKKKKKGKRKEEPPIEPGATEDGGGSTGTG